MRDIGKAEPHMADAVPAMGVDDVWLTTEFTAKEFLSQL